MSKNEKIPWSIISKIVGWNNTSVEYPTIEQVDQICERAVAGEMGAMVELLRYFRFLRIARSDNQREIIGRIIDAIFAFRNKHCQ